MPSVLKSRSLFETEIDPDAILIDMFGDDKLCGTLVLSPEDLRMLVNLRNLLLCLFFFLFVTFILGSTEFK